MGILQLNYVGGCWSFGSVNDLEDDFGAFLEGFEPIGIDPAMVNKEVTAVILGDETITLCIIKPFYCSF